MSDPNNSNILGPTVGINASSAEDVLAARIAGISQIGAVQGETAGPGASLSSEDAANIILSENQAASAGPAAAYADARRIDVAAMKQARGEFAQMGLHDLAASNNPIFKNYAASVQQQARYDAGYADTPELPDMFLSGDAGGTLYDSARNLNAATEAQIKEEYTAARRFDQIGTSAGYKTELALRQQQAQYDAGFVQSPAMPDIPVAGSPTLFESAKHLDRLTETELKEEYTGTGRYNQVGTSGYKKELEERTQQSRYDAGFTNSPDAPVEHKESLKDILGGMDMAYAVAYGGMQAIGSEQKALAPMLSGDAYLADQVNEQAATGVLPFAGAIAGTLIGLRGGPAAGLAGQYIGQQAGASAEEGIDTFLTGHQFAQERAGESLGIGRGGKDAADEFADALKNVVTPAAKELAEVFAKLGQTGPVTASGAAGLAPFQNEFGTAFAGAVAGEDRFLGSSPFLAGMRQQFGSNAEGIAAGDYLGAAGIAAFTDDYPGMQANLGFAQAKAGRDVENPNYRRDRDFVERFRKTEGVGQDIKDFFTGDGGQGQAYQDAEVRLGYNAATGKYDMPGGEAQYLSRQDATKAKQIAGSTKIYTDAYEAHQQNEADLQYASAGAVLGLGQLQTAMTRGGGAAAERAALPGINSALTRAEGDITKDITGLETLEKQSPALAKYYDTLIRQDEGKREGMVTEQAKLTTEVFKTGLGEEDAGFSLTTTRGALSGRSAASQSEGYRRQEAFLSGVAEDPRNPLSPTERAGIESGVAQMRYAQAQRVYGEENAEIGISRAEREGTQQRESILGTPEGQYQAALGGAASDREQIAQNQSEIRRGNLTRPQILGLTQQDVRLQADIDVTPERARIAAYDAEGSILSSEQSAGRADLSRSQSVLGGKAFTPTILAKDQAEIDLYAGAEAGSPALSSQRARFGAEKAQAAAREQEDKDSSYQFGDQKTRVSELRAEGTFERSLKNPYQDGDPSNNPFTAGRAYEGVLKTDLSKAETALKATPQDSPTYEKNAEAVEQYKNKIADLEETRRRGFEEMLPEMIAGSPGRGRLTGIALTPGQSAFYSPNPFITGSFGKPDTHQTYDGEGHVAQPGGAAGAFLAATAHEGGAAGSGGISSADARALAAAMHRFIDFAQRQGVSSNRTPVFSGASTNGVDAYGANGGR